MRVHRVVKAYPPTRCRSRNLYRMWLCLSFQNLITVLIFTLSCFSRISCVANDVNRFLSLYLNNKSLDFYARHIFLKSLTLSIVWKAYVRRLKRSISGLEVSVFQIKYLSILNKYVIKYFQFYTKIKSVPSWMPVNLLHFSTDCFLYSIQC